MKLPAIFLTLSFLALVGLGIIYVIHVEQSKNLEFERSHVKYLEKRKKQQRDSLNAVIALKDDTIRIAKNTIILQADTLKRDRSQRENYKRNTHEKIHFVDLVSNAKRDSVLANLYPSFRTFR